VLEVPEVRLREVSKRFGRIEALKDLDIEVKSGEYLCVLGPTGSGKTTLLRLIAGLINPDRGEIYFDGRLVNDLPPEERDTAYLPQHYALFPHMTVLSNVAFGPLSRGIPRDEAFERAYRVLELVRLNHRAGALPKELSGGMQQRIALARALASGAGLLLLDEPLGALDARLRIELRYHLKSLVKRMRLTAIHVTHDQREAMMLADRMVVLRAGKVEQIGTPYHVYLRPSTLFVANFIGEKNFLEGIVKNIDSAGAVVELRDGLLVRVRETSYLPGERVVVAIRHELTSLRVYGWDGVNALPAEAKAIRFLGSSIRVDTLLYNGTIVCAKVPISQASVLPKPRERLAVAFRPGDAVVFSAPSGGLAKEIEVV
jgi:putative spermidine/putrescine transport system ATP-binding protein